MRQGKNLSHFLFAMFLNDLDEFLIQKVNNGLNPVTEEIEKHLDLTLRLFTLLYADDTILMADSAIKLQEMLDAFHEYCQKWKLKVNIQKSKIMVFSRGANNQNSSFKIDKTDLEVVEEFSYLCCIFQKSYSFKSNVNYLIKKATCTIHARSPQKGKITQPKYFVST